MPTKESTIPQETHSEVNMHDFAQQMLNPLVVNKAAALASTTLFLDIPTHIPNEADDEDVPQKPPLALPKDA